MVESHLVGQSVDCPGCASEILVPEIRDGLQPRLRPIPGSQASVIPTSFAREEFSGDVLIENFQSLHRRNDNIGRQLEHMQSNAELCVKQIELFKLPSDLPPVEQADLSTASSEGRGFVLLSIGFGALALVGSVVALFLL